MIGFFKKLETVIGLDGPFLLVFFHNDYLFTVRFFLNLEGSAFMLLYAQQTAFILFHNTVNPLILLIINRTNAVIDIMHLCGVCIHFLS